MKLAEVIGQLVEEKGLDKNVLISIVCEGMLAAYKKKYPDLDLMVEYNKKSGELEVSIKKTVVSNVQDEDKEISLRKAKSFNPDIETGDQIDIPFEEKIGRIETLKAKQVISEKIRSIEYDFVYKAFKDKQGLIVNGTIHRCERNGFLVKIQDAFAFLPKTLTIPDDKCIVGHPIRALLKEVLLIPRNDSQLILDRRSKEFLKHLFELEIPEVYERLVEIKTIVRIPGYKSKVVVVSNDPNIDPVGTCVGIGGARIKPILKELGQERIDVIKWNDSLSDLVKDALKPAVINKVEIVDNKIAKVWLNEDQRSLAIGKMGQNIDLASQLTGLDIQLMESEKKPEVLKDFQSEVIEEKEDMLD